MIAVCDLDDYPLGEWERSIEWLDEMHAVNRGFRCTVFAVPAAMEERHWQPLVARERWLHVGWHGFIHGYWECKWDLDYGRLFKMFDDKRFAPIFKPCWYGASVRCVEAVRDRGLIFAARTIEDLQGVEGVRVVFLEDPAIKSWVVHTHARPGKQMHLPWNVPRYLEWAAEYEFKFAEELAV